MADNQKARDIAGIRKRSIAKYGKGRMQSTANLEATYARTHPRPKAKSPNGTPAGSLPRSSKTSVPKKGPTVIPLRKPKPKPIAVGTGTRGVAGQRGPIDYGKTIPGPRPGPIAQPLRGGSNPKPTQGGGQIGVVSGATVRGTSNPYSGVQATGKAMMKPVKPKKGIQ